MARNLRLRIMFGESTFVTSSLLHRLTLTMTLRLVVCIIFKLTEKRLRLKTDNINILKINQ